MSFSQEAMDRRIAVIGRLRVDLGSDVVRDADGGAVLNRRSEALLLYLCRHANTLVTRERILEDVWEGRPVEEAAITNCIWYIRRAIGDEARDIVQTHARRGYSLTLPDSAWQVPVPPTSPGEDAFAPLRGPRWRSTANVAVAAVVVSALAAVLLFWHRTQVENASSPFLTVSIVAPDLPPSVRDALLREVAVAAVARGGDFLPLQRVPRSLPPGSAHLAVSISPRDASAVLSLRTSAGLRQRRFRGPEAASPSTIRRFLDDVLEPRARSMNSAAEAYVDGRLAEARFDRIRAIERYRRAVARDPGMSRAAVALALALHRQGRSAEAVEWAQRARALKRSDAVSDCRLARLVARILPSRHRRGDCVAAEVQMALQRGELSDVIARVDAESPRTATPHDWLSLQIDGILAALRSGDFASALQRIARAEASAEQLGWASARIDIAAQRSLVFLFQGRLQEAAAVHAAAAVAYARLGDAESADLQTLYALRAMPPELGAESTRRRQLLQRILLRSQRLGSVENEREALQLLARIDRGRVPEWEAHIARLTELGERMLSPEDRTQNTLYVLDEYRFVRRYMAVIGGLPPAASEMPIDIAVWRELLEFEARFARDELDAAAAVLARMQGRDFDLADTGNTCQFAWFFAERGDVARARELLARCDEQSFDRLGQAVRGDHGLLAHARLYRRDGRPAEAWGILSDRIRALGSLADATPQEVESLLTLARHASYLPGADRALLEQALRRGEAAMDRDGAGPGLRYGVHVLRWRLCVGDRAVDCGPPLPEWAQEDRFDARLASSMLR